MPNHITNIVEFDTDEVMLKKILEAIQNDEYGIGSIDFNKILPMPQELSIECGSRSDAGLKLYSEFVAECLRDGIDTENITQRSDDDPLISDLVDKYRQQSKRDPEAFDFGKQCFFNLQKYGAPTWYEWSIKNWGTKWNAYEFEHNSGSGQIKFQTAWSSVPPIMERLSAMFPDVTLQYAWADEDFGFNCGTAKFSNGECTEMLLLPGGSPEAIELAGEVIGFNPLLGDDEEETECMKL